MLYPRQTPNSTEHVNISWPKDLLIKLMMTEIDQLKDNDLLLMEMHFFEKRSYKEIADILDIKEGNAKVKVHRIKERIRKRINF